MDDIRPAVLWNFFAKPFAVAGRQWKRLDRKVDAFESTGRGRKKTEASAVYSLPAYCTTPDSEAI